MKLVKMLGVGLLAISVMALVSCNTMKGAGQDLQAGGKALSNSAEKHGAN